MQRRSHGCRRGPSCDHGVRGWIKAGSPVSVRSHNRSVGACGAAPVGGQRKGQSVSPTRLLICMQIVHISFSGDVSLGGPAKFWRRPPLAWPGAGLAGLSGRPRCHGACARPGRAHTTSPAGSTCRWRPRRRPQPPSCRPPSAATLHGTMEAIRARTIRRRVGRRRASA